MADCFKVLTEKDAKWANPEAVPEGSVSGWLHQLMSHIQQIREFAQG